MKAIRFYLVDEGGNPTDQLPPNVDLQFGPTGFCYLGLFCFSYQFTLNGTKTFFNGPMQWINSKNAIFFPEDGKTVAGFACYLKPGVRMKKWVLDDQIDGTVGLEILGGAIISPIRGTLP